MCQGLWGVTTKVSFSPQARVWQPSPPAAQLWLPTATTGTTWATLPVTAPVEIPSSMVKPPSTTLVSPRLTQVTSGWISFWGSSLFCSWPQCWKPQACSNIFTCDLAWEATRKPSGGQLRKVNARPPSWMTTTSAIRLPGVLGPFEPPPPILFYPLSPTLPHPIDQASCHKQKQLGSFIEKQQNTKREVEKIHSLLHKPHVSLPYTP